MKRSKKGLLAIICLAIIAVIVFVVFKNSFTNKKAWPTDTLADHIPQYSAKVHEFYAHSDSVEIKIDGVSQEKYEQYVEKCKKAGFDRDIEKLSSKFSAYDQDGYKISLHYWSSSKSLSIYVDEPISANGEISWPKNLLTERIPEPSSLIGKIDSDSSSIFRVTLAGISKDAYKAYVDECRSSGFDVDYKVTENLFRADDADGYSLEIEYKGNDTISIKITAPDPVDEEESTEDRQTEETPDKNIPEESTTEEKTTEAKTETPVGIRAEIKEAIDSYEQFIDTYCEFMKTYDASDLTMLAKYAELMQKEYEMTKKFEEIEDMDLSDDEEYYYAQVQLRCSQKMLECAYNMD